MTKQRSTKRALFMSALSLLLCVSMLVGTTYAWFTDEVVSGMNTIAAGNLDVELKAGGNVVDANTKLFSKVDKWEPGVVVYENLQVVNKGNLALKYQMTLNFGNENTLKGHKLSEVLSVAVIDKVADGATRADILAAAQSAKFDSLYDFFVAGELEAGNVSTEQAVVVFWAPNTNEIDNRYNANNGQTTSDGQPLHIEFGVNLQATQKMHESDSFGTDYDAEAAFGTYTILEAGDDLNAALAAADADKPLTIKLNGDVEYATAGSAGGVADVTPATSVVIDGNGYTITVVGAGVTPIGDKEAPVTLKNVKIVDNSESYRESAWELSYCELGGVINCVNVDFADAVMVEGTSASFVDCSFVGHNDKITGTTQYAAWVSNGDATFTNCTVSGTRGIKICDQYSPEVGTVVIDGCTFDGISEKPGVAIDDEDAQDMKITIKNSTFINCQAGDQGLYIYETDNTVPTLENNIVLNNASVISTKEEFLALSAKAFTGNNGKAEEKTFILDADIDLEGAEFSAMIAQRGDTLNFVGNGHKISNAKIVSGADDNTTGQASMFYAYPNSTLNVSNLTIENATVTAEANGTGYAAAVIGYCEGNVILNNVDVVNATVIGVKSSGLLAGHMSGKLEATGCDLSGTVTLADFADEAAGHYAGKYFGTIAGAATLENCTVNATVSGNLKAGNDGDIYGRMTAAGSLN